MVKNYFNFRNQFIALSTIALIGFSCGGEDVKKEENDTQQLEDFSNKKLHTTKAIRNAGFTVESTGRFSHPPKFPFKLFL